MTMNKKFMGLAFVVIVAGCQPPQQGAVCPASEEEEVAEPAPVPDNPQTERDPEWEKEVERAERRTRATRRQ